MRALALWSTHKWGWCWLTGIRCLSRWATRASSSRQRSRWPRSPSSSTRRTTWPSSSTTRQTSPEPRSPPLDSPPCRSTWATSACSSGCRSSTRRSLYSSHAACARPASWRWASPRSPASARSTRRWCGLTSASPWRIPSGGSLSTGTARCKPSGPPIAIARWMKNITSSSRACKSTSSYPSSQRAALRLPARPPGQLSPATAAAEPRKLSPAVWVEAAAAHSETRHPLRICPAVARRLRRAAGALGGPSRRAPPLCLQSRGLGRASPHLPHCRPALTLGPLRSVLRTARRATHPLGCG
mmetsp:Transcript_1065/g.3380  ORF Transcript_1065/g.3380 Transcript_1065/m.3380 type:complete len:299 (+) Transcript_1065:351-1247(+)